METTACPPSDAIPWRCGWWNIPIPLRIFFFSMMALAVIIMIYFIIQRVRLWRAGQPEIGFNRPWARLLRTLKYGVAQVKILRQRYPAAMHLGIFWGMVLLFVGTVLGSLDTDVFELIFNTKLLQGNLYLLEKVVLDLAALFVLVGLGLAVYRRYIVKPDRLNTDWRFNFTLPLLAFIILTGLLVEALRLAAMQPAWAPYSVVAYPLSLLFGGLDEAVLLGLHRGMWTIHFAAVAVAFATLPLTNLFHIFTSPVNIFVAPFRVKGALETHRQPGDRRAVGRQEAGRPPLAAAGQRGRLHRMRPLSGRVPGVRGQPAAESEEAGAGSAGRADCDWGTRRHGDTGTRVTRRV